MSTNPLLARQLLRAWLFRPVGKGLVPFRPGRSLKDMRRGTGPRPTGTADPTRLPSS